MPRWQIAGAVDFNRALATGRAQSLDDVTADPRRPGLLQYRGTTGVAKGAMLTHGNMVATCCRWEPGCRPA